MNWQLLSSYLTKYLRHQFSLRSQCDLSSLLTVYVSSSKISSTDPFLQEVSIPLLIQWERHTHIYHVTRTLGVNLVCLLLSLLTTWLRVSLRTYWYYVTEHSQNSTNFQQQQNKCIQGTVSKKVEQKERCNQVKNTRYKMRVNIIGKIISSFNLH